MKIDFNKLRNWKRLNFAVDTGTANINNFEKQAKIGSGSFGSVYKIIDKTNKMIYAAKISVYNIETCLENVIENLSREVGIISGINHPSIFQFIGCSPNDFKNKKKPVIITEFLPNGSLDKILEIKSSIIKHSIISILFQKLIIQLLSFSSE